jgi:hypothetical protein
VALLSEGEEQTLAHDDTPWHDPEHATLLVWIREEGVTPALVLSSPFIGMTARCAAWLGSAPVRLRVARKRT